MAKKNVTLDSLFKDMKKLNPFSESLNKSDFALPTGFIDTGNYMLNAAFTGDIYGGCPNNRAVCLAGESGAGKTYILLQLCKNAQKEGYHIIYYDTEGAVDSEMAENLGIDTSKFQHEPVSSIEKFRTSITMVTKTLIDAKISGGETPKIFIALDSLGMLATEKEINDSIDGSDKADFTRAKKIRSLFRIITSDLTGLKIPLVFTNHVGVNIGGYGDPVVMGGGEGLKYSASIIACFSKAKLKEDGSDSKRQTGIVLTSKMWKNRFAQPHNIKIHLDFKKGLNRFIGLHEYISWDNCGIQRGNLISQKDYDKLGDADREKARCFTHDDNDLIFYPKDTARNFIVKHLGTGVTAKDLFTERVFNKEHVLDILNENVIKPKFQFGSGLDVGDEIVDLLTNGEENE
jgi:RecA/RadA recombinase